jgi:Holliday junction resolvase
MNGKLHKEYIKSYIGKKINRLLIVDIIRGNKGQSMCSCICDCKPKEVIKEKFGEIKYFKLSRVVSGHTQSCGCYNKEVTSELIRKYNEYKYIDNNIIELISSNNPNKLFYIDSEDLNKIINYCWRFTTRGYIETTVGNKTIKLHQLILNRVGIHDNLIIDHNDRNPLNNKKENLRLIEQDKNAINSSIQSNNTSGIIGVSWDKKECRWIAQLNYQKNHKYIGSYKDFNKAIIARLQAELKYFGPDFAPQRHLFEQYGIV